MATVAGTEISGLIVALAAVAVIGCAAWRSGARLALASAGLAVGLTWVYGSPKCS